MALWIQYMLLIKIYEVLRVKCNCIYLHSSIVNGINAVYNHCNDYQYYNKGDSNYYPNVDTTDPTWTATTIATTTAATTIAAYKNGK